MTKITNATQTVKNRLGLMSDAALDDISILPLVRDVFCEQDITFVADKDVYAGMLHKRFATFDLIGPRMHYSPMLEKYGSDAMNLKIIAHECGHSLRQIQYDYVTPVNASVLAFLGVTQNVVKHGYRKFNEMQNDENVSRREFLKNGASFAAIASGLIGSTYGLQQWASYQEESSADMIADAIVPEHTMHDTFDELFKIYKDNKDDPDAKPNRSRLTYITSRIFSNHPDLDKRYAMSDKNCKRFANNTKLWSPDT